MPYSEEQKKHTAIAMFPSSVIANGQKLQKAEFFTAEEPKKADVTMAF